MEQEVQPRCSRPDGTADKEDLLLAQGGNRRMQMIIIQGNCISSNKSVRGLDDFVLAEERFHPPRAAIVGLATVARASPVQSRSRESVKPAPARHRAKCDSILT